MKFSPEPKTSYLLPTPQDKVIFEKLAKFESKKLTKEEEEIVKLLYSQIEENWRDPLEKFIDRMLEK